MEGWLILLAIIAIVLITLVTLYNKIVSLKNFRENAAADIEVQMKMRFDLVENLVNTVKGYASHEKETLEKVTAARTSFMQSQSIEDKMGADQALTGALKTLFAVSESYPELKANTNFLQLQTELSDIENKIAAARRYFNSTTREYNTKIETFPGNVIASMFKFGKFDSFEITDESEKVTPKVQF